MPHPVPCPHCGLVSYVPDSWGNAGFICPNCNQPVNPPKVPRARPAPPRARPVRRRQPRAAGHWEKYHLVYLVAVAVVVIAWVVAIIPIPADKPQTGASDSVREAPAPVQRPRGPAVELLDQWASPFTTAAGQHTLRVGIRFRNTGDRPVRKVKGIIRVYDADGNEIRGGTGGLDYTLYAAFDDAPGVLPGETYSTPSGQGFILTGPRPAKLGMQLTSASEDGIPTD